MLPKVTVLMPAYNCAGFLPDSIRSILNQTYKNFEFLIIDNASSDNTREVISSYKDPRIIYHRIEERGIGNALNCGLKAASNDIIVRMDADDISLPDRIEKQLNFFLKQEEECIISCSYGVFEKCDLKFIVNVSTKNEDLKKRLALHSEIIHAGMVYNRNTILNAGGYKNFVFEDYELLLRMKDKIKFYNLKDVLLLVRYRNDSESRKDIKKKNKIIYNIQKPYYENDLNIEFDVCEEKANEIRGWREFFYGNKNTSRLYWKKNRNLLFKRPKVLLAYSISFLPDKFLTLLKEKRIPFRFNNFLNYFSPENKKLKNFLKRSCT